MKVLKWIAISLVVVVVAIQLYRPARTNPPIDDASTVSARLQVPADVAAILDRSCVDCHTHKTVWPWYSNVAPVSWLLTRDVNEGRRHLDLSNWPTDPRRSARRLEEICDQVEQKEMPMGIYVRMHPLAKLSDGDIARLCEWANSERQRISATNENQAAAGTPSK